MTDRELTQEQREQVTRVVDINTSVSLALLSIELAEENSKFYKMEQKNAFKRAQKNIDIVYGLSRMGEEDRAYTESLKEALNSDFIIEFKRQYRVEVEKGLGFRK